MAFMDTCIIVGASYLRNIDYPSSVNIDLIDNKASDCLSILNKIGINNVVICERVINELRILSKIREISFEIVVLKLAKANSTIIEEKFDDLNDIRIVDRDYDWIENIFFELKDCDLEDVNYIIDKLQLAFNRNINTVIRNAKCKFTPKMHEEADIKIIVKFLNSSSNKPNRSDKYIYANSIIYNSKEEVIFITTDRGYEYIDCEKLEQQMNGKLNYSATKIKII